jgi:phage anti-repressor protein
MELINITQTESGIQAVLATDLYNFLEPTTKYNDWIKRMLKYDFVEKIDFYLILSKSAGGRPKTEYVLTLDCAKSIAMLQRSEKGRQIRAYFIEVEKQFKTIATPQQIQDLHTRIVTLENKQIDWTIDRYLNANKPLYVLTKSERQQSGKLCTKLCRQELEKEPKKVPHPSYPTGQNVYPYELINKAHEQWKKK